PAFFVSQAPHGRFFAVPTEVSMLVLCRKKQQQVVITPPGDSPSMITITVLGIDRGRVRLGIESTGGTAIQIGGEETPLLESSPLEEALR
ncbi:MAG: carbon storage regulator, partial [Planctomycetota bacterium]